MSIRSRRISKWPPAPERQHSDILVFVCIWAEALPVRLVLSAPTRSRPRAKLHRLSGRHRHELTGTYRVPLLNRTGCSNLLRSSMFYSAAATIARQFVDKCVRQFVKKRTQLAEQKRDIRAPVTFEVYSRSVLDVVSGARSV